MNYESLDGYTVEVVTDKAVGLRRGKLMTHREPVWVPRSVIENGDEISKGDTDICVAKWFIEKEDLITD